MERLMNIGIFDSGLGGLTLARPFLSKSSASIIYVGDTANMPYGSKTQEHIQHISSTIVTFLEQQVDCIIVACHTASTTAGVLLKKSSPNTPIITMHDTIIPQALAATSNNKIGIIATPTTIQTHAYGQALTDLNKKIEVIEQACPTLAPAIEKYFDNPHVLKKIVFHYLEPMIEANIDTLILGCTHYALVKDIIHEITPDMKIISSDETILDVVQLPNNFISETHVPKHRFFASGDTKIFRRKLEFYLDLWNIKKCEYLVEKTPWQTITLPAIKDKTPHQKSNY